MKGGGRDGKEEEKEEKRRRSQKTKGGVGKGSREQGGKEAEGEGGNAHEPGVLSTRATGRILVVDAGSRRRLSSF